VISLILAAGPGFRKTVITAGMVMRNETDKGEKNEKGNNQYFNWKGQSR
jgi:hypothetical protein